MRGASCDRYCRTAAHQSKEPLYMKFGRSMLAAALIVASGAVACSPALVGPPTLDDAQIDADIAATSGDAVASQITSFGDNVTAAGSFTMVAPSYDLNAGGSVRLDG